MGTEIQSVSREGIRIFSLGELLSITTGRLLCTMDELSDNVSWLVGEPVFTAGLPHASRVLTPYIYNTFPDLLDIEIPEDLAGEEACQEFLAELTDMYGNNYALSPLSPGVWK